MTLGDNPYNPGPSAVAKQTGGKCCGTEASQAAQAVAGVEELIVLTVEVLPRTYTHAAQVCAFLGDFSKIEKNNRSPVRTPRSPSTQTCYHHSGPSQAPPEAAVRPASSGRARPPARMQAQATAHPPAARPPLPGLSGWTGCGSGQPRSWPACP